MRYCSLAFVILVFGASLASAQVKPQKYNVLFIISDDLRAECGCYGGLAKTPNIDALAKASLRFDRAYCQYPLCNPSRASLLTGQYPTHTSVLGNRTDFRVAHLDWVSLPQLFRLNGYSSLRSGKIFHGGIDDQKAWTEGAEKPGETKEDADAGGDHPIYAVDLSPTTAPSEFASHHPGPNDAQLNKAQNSDRWIVLDGDGEGSGDNHVAERTIELLDKYKDKPFFIGCGFYKPHSPPTAPQKYYEMYDVNQIPLPPDYASKPTLPAGFPLGSIRPRNADLFIGRDSTPQTAREMMRAYLASTSWCDWNVGRVLAELDKLDLRKNTIIIFWGDHGYQLGEKGKWSKAGSVWEQGARVPFTMYVPGAKANGQVCTRVVEMVDLYPTLAELCGLPMPPQGLEGISLSPLLDDPNFNWNHPAFTCWSEDGTTLTAKAIRTDKWRYAEFTAGKGGAMLLDESADPHEMKNLADDPTYAKTCQEMSAMLQKFSLPATAK